MTVEIIHVQAPDHDTIAGRRAIWYGEPWIVPEALEFLKSIVQPSWLIYEWGAGGSTVWFAKRCHHVMTVECRLNWVERVNAKLKAENVMSKVYMKCYQLGGINEKREYADDILNDSIPDGNFDLIYVDGEPEVRTRCIKNALRKLKPDGWLMVDNSNWWIERDAVADWHETQYITEPYEWLGKVDEWATSFFRRP